MIFNQCWNCSLEGYTYNQYNTRFEKLLYPQSGWCGEHPAPASIMTEESSFALVKERLGYRDRVTLWINAALVVSFPAVALVIQAAEYQTFACKDYGKGDVKYIQQSCRSQHSKDCHSLFLWLYVFISFFIPAVICVVYSQCCVQSRVNTIKELLDSDQGSDYKTFKTTTKGSYRVYFCCLTQLFVRFVVRIVLMVTQLTLYSSSGACPTEFSCNLEDGDVTCVNPSAIFIRGLSVIIAICHLCFALFLICEMGYLIYKLYKDSKYHHDSVFCQKYLHI